MSNRQFKTLLSNSKYVLFDYGDLTELPNIQPQLAGICRVQNIFYIKQKNANSWTAIIADKILINVVYNIDNKDKQYWWLYHYNGQLLDDSFNSLLLKCTNFQTDDNAIFNPLFLWKHNQHDHIDCSFYRTIDNGESYQKINVPYNHINEDTIIADFSGFTIQNEDQNQSFYISCK